MGALLTFGQAKASIDLANISGVCGSSEQFRSYLNQAVEALMTRGNWFGAVRPMRVCVYNNCVTWPREVGTILATNICGRPIPQKDFWYEYLPINQGEWGNWGLASDFRGGTCGGNVVFENAGLTSVIAQPQCNVGSYIRSYPSTKADIGKKITWFGIDDNGQVVRSVQDGILQDGVVVTLQLPFAVTPIRFRRVDRAVKQITQGPVRNYYYDGTNLWDCATYDPTETSPVYNFSKLTGWRQNRQTCPLTNINALVKLQFIPVTYDNDLVLISNTRAIKLMIKAIRKEDGDEDSIKTEMAAFRELNYELRDKFPIEQFVSTFKPFGTANFQRVTGGFI